MALRIEAPSPPTGQRQDIESSRRQNIDFEERGIYGPSRPDDREKKSLQLSRASSAITLGQFGKIGDLPLRSKASSHFLAEVDTKRTDLILVVCGFVSGLVDGLAFNAWGSFASMQTGNTVFVALGVSGQPRYPAFLWAKSLIAIMVFIVGNIFFINASRLLSPLRRLTLVTSFALQTAALLAATLLVHTGVVAPKPEDPTAPIEWIQVVPLSLLAFQAAGQIVTSRILAFDEIPTVVLTTLLCDLLVDGKLYVRPWRANPKRNRRIAAFLALFLGAMTAGGLVKVSGMSSALWLAAGLKGSVTLVWLVWREKSDGGVENGEAGGT